MQKKLNISDKTVSKWECGKGFPEVSLLLPLCKELDITVNELLSGARVSEEEYQKKAEENMVNMIKRKRRKQEEINSYNYNGFNCNDIIYYIDHGCCSVYRGDRSTG